MGDACVDCPQSSFGRQGVTDSAGEVADVAPNRSLSSGLEPPSHRRSWKRTLIVIGAIVVAAAVAFVVYYYVAIPGVNAPGMVQMNAEEWRVDYANLSVAYLDVRTSVFTYSGPAGSTFAQLLNVTLTSTYPSPRNITSITVDFPFELKSISPVPPLQMTPAETIDFHLNITLPDVAGGYIFSGNVYTD